MTAAVLGTRIVAGEPAARALLISDLHVPDDASVDASVGASVGAPVGAPVGATDGAPHVVASLQAAIDAAVADDAALFVLGDLFDSYICRAQVGVGVWRDVAAAFRRATDAGLRVVLLVGNRDFLLGDEFAQRSGVELVHGGYRATLGGVDTLLLHGDELCQNDLPYQRAKRWLRSAWVRGVARRLPVAVARRVAARARRRSRAVIERGDQTRFLPSERAVASAFATGVGRLVFGHIHRFAGGPFGGGRYHVLPAFDAAAAGLAVDDRGARPVRFPGAGATVPAGEAPPCPWSA